ncbi:hypothetical protein LP421_11395 [Rhizobium sp. RCAM05350]|nr:hypothetical protein LP421_11395 [Rhizobium sp. RCAM05350]
MKDKQPSPTPDDVRKGFERLFVFLIAFVVAVTLGMLVLFIFLSLW